MISNSFNFRNAKRVEIYKILLNIGSNKAYKFDEIPGRFLKDGAELLTEPLCKIIDLSLSSKFPIMCKRAKLKPLFKEGKNTEYKNYRLVSLLPISFSGQNEKFRFTSKTIEWFGSYLKKRNIVVSLEKTFSEIRILNCGVPQRLILGPTLFLLYVNNIKTALKNYDVRLYAGETCIPFRHQNVKIIEKKLSYDR